MSFVFRRLLVSLPALHVIREYNLDVIICLEMKYMCVSKRIQVVVFFPSFGQKK